MNDFDFHHQSLIKSQLETEDKKVKNCILQFYGITNELDYSWLYKGTKVKTRVYNDRQFQYKKHMAPPKVIDFSRVVLSPMPGAIVSVAVKEGDTVEDGQELLVMEAMKMQNLIKSEREGKIKTVRIKKGDAVAVDAVLIEFE